MHSTRRRWGMAAAAVLFAGSAQAQSTTAATSTTETEQPPVERPGGGRRSALWVTPFAPLFGPLGRWYNFNLGYSRSLGRGLDLVIEGGGGYRENGGGTGLVTFGVSAGVAFLLSGTTPLNGWFVLPKLQVRNASDFGGYTDSISVGAALEAGYQVTFGGFYLAPVLGVGYQAVIPTNGSPVRYGTGLELALVRVGYAWDTPATEAEARSGFDLQRWQRRRDRAVWITPLWVAIGPLFGRYNVGLGANLPLAERVSAVVEAGVEWGSERGTGPIRGNYTAWQAALGVAFALTGRGGMEGLFLQPKLHAANYTVSTFGGLSPALSAGGALDIGYHITVGPMYLAPVVGVGATWIALTDPTSMSGQPRGLQPYFNVTLLRMGAAF